MDIACVACNEPLSPHKTFLCCSECSYGYHLGNCSGVTENSFKKKNAEAKKTWKCQTCLKCETRGKSTRQEQAPSYERVDGSTLNEINAKLSAIMTLHAKVDTLMEMKATVDAIECSVQLMSDNYDALLSQVQVQGKEIQELKKRVTEMESSKNSNDVEVKQLKREINNLEQYSRRQNIEVHGLAQTPNEDLLNQLNLLSDLLELPKLTEKDIESVHRLPPRPERVPVILVRFSSRLTRNVWLQQNAALKELNSPVRIYENMSAQNKRLFWQIKTKATEKGYRFMWHKEGKMFVRKAVGDRIVRIESEDDLELIR